MGKLAKVVRDTVVKLQVFSYDGEQVSNVLSEDEKQANSLFSDAGVLKPPYDPNTLAAVFEASNALRQNIDAYATNIDKFGHRFDPVIDITATDVDEKIAEIIRMERVELAAEKPGDQAAGLIAPEPTAAEIAARKKLIEDEIRVEHMRLEQFFKFCCADYSFLTARERQRIDRESTGNGYFEITRNRLKKITGINHVPSPSMRLLRRGEPIPVNERISITPITFKTVERQRKFRRYLQVTEGASVYFKEFGDPRVMSARSGKYYDTPELMLKAEPKAVEATEILHFLIYWPRGGAYGVPRWIGNLLSVLGSHQAEEVNFLYFDNKTIPSMMVAVEGGRLQQAAVSQLKDLFENGIKGKKNFHKCIVLEALPAESGVSGAEGKVRIRMQPLTDQQIKDGLFQDYDDRNRHKVGQSFRMPPIVRGDTKDFNRSTSDAALALAEDQVFAPERREFDYTVNRKIFPELDVKYHEFVSNGLQLTDPESRAEAIKTLEDFLTPEEGREFAEPVFGKRLPKIEQGWTKQPLKLTLMDVQAGAGADGADGGGDGGGDQPPPEDGAPAKDSKTAKPPKDGKGAPPKKGAKPVQKGTSLLREAERIISVRNQLAAAEGGAAMQAFRTESRKNEETGQEETVIFLPAELMSELVTEQDS